MSNSKITKRYATALFLNATENGHEELLGEVQKLEKTIAENQPLYNLFKDAAIDSLTKAGVLERIFKDASPVIKNTLLLLCEKRRENVIDDVIKEFYKLHDTYSKRVKATVTSALPIDTATEKAISALVQEKTGAKHIELTNSIDKSILGGFVVRFGDNLIDTSISSQLNKIKKEFKLA